MLSEDTAQPVVVAASEVLQEQQQLPQHTCWSCLGSGYSDYAIGQPCEVCGGWGHWESIV